MGDEEGWKRAVKAAKAGSALNCSGSCCTSLAMGKVQEGRPGWAGPGRQEAREPPGSAGVPEAPEEMLLFSSGGGAKMAGEGLQPRPPFQRLLDTKSESAAGVCLCIANASKPCVCVCVWLRMQEGRSPQSSETAGNACPPVAPALRLSRGARGAQDLALPGTGIFPSALFSLRGSPRGSRGFQRPAKKTGIARGSRPLLAFKEPEALPGARKKGGSLQPRSRVCWAVVVPAWGFGNSGAPRRSGKRTRSPRLKTPREKRGGSEPG